jgi:hypothetical protein
LATSADVEGRTGKYYLNDTTEGRSREVYYNEDLQNKLWNLSEEMIGESFKI